MLLTCLLLVVHVDAGGGDSIVISLRGLVVVSAVVFAA